MIWISRERNYTEEQQLIIEQISNKYSTDLFVSSLIAERTNFDMKEVDYFLSPVFKPISPFGLKNMDKAIDLIHYHMDLKHKIMIMTDFDNDGLNCAYELNNTFEALGYEHYEIYIPHRQKETYGLSVHIVELARKKGVKLIITADNGISAFEAIKKGNELGIDVLVTDHHEVILTDNGDVKLPDAKVIVNPHLLDCPYPYKMLSGGGVAYKLSQALIMKAPAEARHRFLTEGYKEKVICSAAISAIADVMKITGENRALVKEALKLIDNGAIPAIKAILGNKPCNVYNISFVIAPRLASVARLDDMNKSFQFMCEEDPEKLLILKEEIESYNDRRKEMQEQGLKIVQEKLATYDAVPKVIIEVVDGLPETLIGLISGKVKEEYGVPTVIFSKTNKGDYKGSGRSIDAYDLFGEISPFLKPENRVTGGGHPMACGLRAEDEEAINNLREFLLAKCTLTTEDLTPKLKIDKYISIRDDLEKLHNSINLLAPFGTGNPAPTFAIKSVYLDFEYKKYKDGEFAKVLISDGEDDFTIDGISWNESVYLRDGRKIFDVVKADIIVDIEMNSYTKQPQLNIKSIKYS